MKIVFSMDGIKNMDLLYTWEMEQGGPFGDDIEVEAEHYHGKEYCEKVIAALPGWQEKKYLGMHGRIANETFNLISQADTKYTVAFGINTFGERLARLEVAISCSDTENYDQKLEGLKIALKDKLLSDWEECTWHLDEQSAKLCKEAYEQAYIIENKLRAFASKVLIHFLGVGWLRRAGLEKQAESVRDLKDKFTQRVPEFENINTDFLSMTLETLIGIMFEGIVYKDEVVLSRQHYETLQTICNNAKSASNVADYVKARRTVEKNLWPDLFIPYIGDPEAFKSATHNFIENRNHVAHSKVLSWNSYQVMLRDFQKLDKQLCLADEKFDREEASAEVLATWEAVQENAEYEEEYIRDRISSETGMEILSEQSIADWFDEVLHELFFAAYQRYHLNMEYDISDFHKPCEEDVVFSVFCPVDEDIHITVIAEYSIDDARGEESICCITAKDSEGEEICSAEVRFHNGDGREGDNGLMEATENTEYDTSELDEFKDELFSAIDSLNPYPAKAEAIVHRSKGIDRVLADFPCEQCGKYGVSIDEEFLPVGKCCFCGWENELVNCDRCGELVSAEVVEDGFCPSCHAYVEKQ